MSKSFNIESTKSVSNIMIVDALNLGFRWKHSGAVHFMDEYIRTVESLAKSYEAGSVVIACDEGSSSYRKAIYPDYKQNRKDKYDAQSEEEKQQFEEFFAEFSLTMDALSKKYPLFFKFPKCEADDIAAYIVNKRRKYNNIWLISSDRDWDLLIDKNISRFSYVTRKEITYDNWSDHYDYSVDDHISIKCLTGDSGDNIPGVSGIGPKKARALVQEYGSTYDIIASMPINSRYKYIANLNEFGSENLLRNYRLMDIVSHCAEALGEENCKYIDTKLMEYFNESSA